MYILFKDFYQALAKYVYIHFGVEIYIAANQRAIETESLSHYLI